jgi:polysaccharide pyruvyl transferase WcaK-like protein
LNSPSPSQIYLVSAAGGNFGDDLITTAWLRFFAKTFPNATVYCDVFDSSFFTWILAEHFPDLKVRVVNTLWSYLKKLPLNTWEILQSARRDTASNSDPLLNLFSDTAGTSDVVHFAGGGYMNSEWPRNLGMLPVVEHLRLSSGLSRLIWTGASIVPLEPVAAFDYSSCFRAFDYISTRDKASHDLLSQFNPATTLTCDDFYVAANLKILPVRTAAIRKNTVILNLQRDLFSTDDFIIAHKSLSDLIRSAPKNYRFIYPELNVFHDKLAYALLPQKHRLIEFLSYTDFWSLLLNAPDTLNATAHAISSRYHLHILLDHLGIPGQWISASAYYDNKHQTLNDLFASKWTKADHTLILEEPSGLSAPTPKASSRNIGRAQQQITRHRFFEKLKAKEMETLYSPKRTLL